ncbi:hypothetical protein [Symbioplanes lichenis]|uniref:hypothetical protein n=1 Tax=Symbioplanes lichenis TaxID=1629072 RepID=UPI00273A31E0|nr:hypothetical protein [Actinoplanes lichenis]
MKRAASIVISVVLVATVAIAVAGQVRRAHREAERHAAAERFRAAHALELSAAAVDASRRGGQTQHFALVPPEMPPGLVRIDPSAPLADDGVTDVYSYGEVRVFVNFTGVPGARPCGAQPCLRSVDLTVRTPDAPSLRHVAVWLSGASPAAERFWTATSWVPVDRAAWFAELAEQGEFFDRG